MCIAKSFSYVCWMIHNFTPYLQCQSCVNACLLCCLLFVHLLCCSFWANKDVYITRAALREAAIRIAPRLSVCPSVIVKRQDRYVNTVRMTHRFISSSRTEDCTFYRAMLCISMVYAGMRCPSVRLSRSWVAPKRIKISSKFFHHPIPNGVALFRREPSP